MSAPLPPDESERLRALRRYCILDTPPEPAFERITALAAQFFGAPIALLSFVDGKRNWFKSRRGLELEQIDREFSFCAHAILGDEVLAVPDLRADARFAANPLVTGPPHARCYAGAPLKTPDGFRLGTLCVLGTEPRPGFPEELLSVLAGLAAIAQDALELRLNGPARAWAAAAIGIAVADAGGRILDTNPAFGRILGYAAEELAGQPLALVLPGGAGTHAKQLCAAIDAGEAWGPAEWRLRRKDGILIDVQATAAPLARGSEPRLGVLTIAEVTALKRREEQLRSAQKMLAISRLAGGAAHGFNNLLTIVTGYSQLLRIELPPGPLYSYAEEIYRASDRAAALTAKLLAFSRHRPGEPRQVDLNELLAKMEPRLRDMIGESIELTIALQPCLAAVFADPAHLEQAVRNLASNACEAMPGGGRLTIRTSSAELRDDSPEARPELPGGRYALLTVEDTGEGMDPEAQKHLFEPFFSTRGMGRGTGLAMVYGIVKQYGGDVAVSSREGLGATVAIYLPALSLSP